MKSKTAFEIKTTSKLEAIHEQSGRDGLTWRGTPPIQQDSMLIADTVFQQDLGSFHQAIFVQLQIAAHRLSSLVFESPSDLDTLPLF